MVFALEPPKPIRYNVYQCDRCFHVAPLKELFSDDGPKYGFIILDGHGCLFGTLSGTSTAILHRTTVDLPNKHGRGGQSAVRFARLRTEKRHNYIRKVAELAVQLLISDGRPNVAGLIIAGSADLKTELAESQLLDPRLAAVVLAVVDVAHGGEAGFRHAIDLCSDLLQDVRFVQEKKVVGSFMQEVALDRERYVFGPEATLQCLEMGAVETLIVWEDLDRERVVLVHPATAATELRLLAPPELLGAHSLQDAATGVELRVEERVPLVEWLGEHYTQYGCELQIVSNSSPEATQFCRGFGGIGGVLRYAVDLALLERQQGEQADDTGTSSDDDEEWV